MSDDTHIFIYLKQIMKNIRTHINENLKEWDLTFSQLHVLKCLDDHGGHMTQRALENSLNVSHPTVVGLVSRLEKNGFVTSAPDKNDHRHKIITLTDKAVSHHASATEQRLQNEAVMLSGLDDDEIRTLENLLKKIIDNIS